MHVVGKPTVPVKGSLSASLWPCQPGISKEAVTVHRPPTYIGYNLYIYGFNIPQLHSVLWNSPNKNIVCETGSISLLCKLFTSHQGTNITKYAWNYAKQITGWVKIDGSESVTSFVHYLCDILYRNRHAVLKPAVPMKGSLSAALWLYQRCILVEAVTAHRHPPRPGSHLVTTCPRYILHLRTTFLNVYT